MRRRTRMGRQHITGGGDVVHVPAVERAEGRRIGGHRGGVVVDRPHVRVGVVVPEQGVIRIVRNPLAAR